MEQPLLPSAGAGRTLDRALALLARIVADGGSEPLRAQAASLGLPLATAYRLVGQLRRHGLVMPGRSGHFVAGRQLAGMASATSTATALAEAARPLLRELARRTRATAHLGIFDGEMVTYVVKESASTQALFTREGGQLEAYCSALGKVLLAHLDSDAREAYLAAGPFLPLTVRTVTDVDAIRATLIEVRAANYAVDDREIADDLRCIAVPVRDSHGRVIAAISLSRTIAGGGAHAAAAGPPAALRRCAEAVGRRIAEGTPWA